MSNAVIQPLIDVPLSPAAGSKLEREKRAFYRHLPQLLTTHRGQFVAIHEERVVDHGSDRLEVALRVLRQVGNVPIYVGLVSEQPQVVSRSGLRRDLGSRGLSA